MLLLIIVLVLLFGVGGWGFNAGWFGGGNPIGLILLILLLLFVFGGLGGHYYGGYF